MTAPHGRESPGAQQGPSSATAGRLAGVRVVVVSTTQPGRRMAGPAIRATMFARGLQALGAEVTLACPETPDADLAVPVVAFQQHRASVFRELARSADVVVTQPLRVDVARGLHSGGARVVYDLYVPSFVEYLAAQAGERQDERVARLLVRRNRLEYAAAVRHGDAFVCASQRQRDHWLGALGQAGRLAAGGDGEVRPRVGVAPFGVPAEPPVPAPKPVLRGRLVPDDAFVLLWTGGLWNWFDPKTLLLGLHDAVTKQPDLRLVILGSGHADRAWRPQVTQSDAIALAQRLGLVASGHVVVADAWVPYEQRGAYLLEADLGVCAYFDSDESRLSFRTRFLDHLWAGLPTVSTAGGWLTDEMARAGAARTVPAGDAAAWTEALVELRDDAAARASMRAAAVDLGRAMRWDAAVDALADVVAEVLVSPRQEGPAAVETVRYLTVLAAVRARLRRGAGPA